MKLCSMYIKAWRDQYHLGYGINFVFCCLIAEAQALTLVMYSAKNIKYPKVIKLQFARPLD